MFEDYRTRMERKGKTLGDALRWQSDVVVNATFNQSVYHREVMVKHIETGLPVFDENVDEIFDAHFEQKSKYNITGDEVAYWLRFRPHILIDHPEIRIGSYVSIPNSDGERDIWLIVHIEDDGEQKWLQVLKTNWIFKWIVDGKTYQTLGCQRYANSYNSGIWNGDRLTFVENMNTAWMPTNNDVDTITYDQRFMIYDGNRKNPICWSISKVETTTPIGLTKLTLSQVPFDSNHDNVELGICNYYDTELPPIDSSDKPTHERLEITYNGTKPTVKVGGSEKVFTVKLPDDNYFDIQWSISDGTNTYGDTYDNYTKTFCDYTITTEDRNLRLKVARNYDIVGTILTIKALCADGSEGEVKVEVVSV